MKAMILAAGRGERLRPLTNSVPKPMLVVDGRPLVEHHVRWLVAGGVTELVINLHHLGDQIANHLGSGRQLGAHIEYSVESERLETGGGIVKALPLLGDQPFITVNADIWIEFDYSELDTSLDGAEQARLLLTPRPSFRQHGDFLYANGKITARGDDYVYCGVSVHHPALFEGLSARRFSLRDLWFAGLENGRVAGQIYTGYWSDIGTPEQLAACRAHSRRRIVT